MRLIYSLIGYLLAPLLLFYLRKRGKKNPQYLQNWHERFGFNLYNPSTKPIIWLHSVSVGETRAMQKLISLLEINLSEYQLLITTMTPTGRVTAQQLYPNALIHYIPYDLSFCVKQFYKAFQPKIGIILETEIWPNLIYFAKQFNLALYLVNARLSDRSYCGYRKFKWPLKSVLNSFVGILCQDQNTANNFTKLGFNGRLEVIGNTKYDLLLKQETLDLINYFKWMFGERKVICLASTRDGEEELLLNALELKSDLLYLIIPRHPERFSELAHILNQRQIKFQKRSNQQQIEPDTLVVIGDSMGEMLAYYAVSYLVIIGGSFKLFGGQNPLEAIFMHKPVIFGKSMYNFTTIAQNSLKDHCAIEVDNAAELKIRITHLINNSEQYQRLCENCSSFIAKYQGASAKVFKVIQESL